MPTALAAEIIHTPPPPSTRIEEGFFTAAGKRDHEVSGEKSRTPLPDRAGIESGFGSRFNAAGHVTGFSVRYFRSEIGEPRKKISWKLIGAALVLCLAITGGFYWRQHHPPLVAKSTTRQSIAVLGFKNDTGNKQDDWISSILTTQLPSELAAGEKVRIVSEEDVNRAKQDLSLTEANTLASDTLTRIKKRLNADRVVLGSFSNVDNRDPSHFVRAR